MSLDFGNQYLKFQICVVEMSYRSGIFILLYSPVRDDNDLEQFM